MIKKRWKPTKIHCKTCNKVFLPKSEKNKFCTRRCFKKDFYHRKKAEELSSNKCPNFICPSCEQKITLDFDPSRDTYRWLHFVCPNCNVLMINVSEEIVTQDTSIN